jgi:hypothetical protein
MQLKRRERSAVARALDAPMGPPNDELQRTRSAPVTGIAALAAELSVGRTLNHAAARD